MNVRKNHHSESQALQAGTHPQRQSQKSKKIHRHTSVNNQNQEPKATTPPSKKATIPQNRKATNPPNRKATPRRNLPESETPTIKKLARSDQKNWTSTSTTIW